MVRRIIATLFVFGFFAVTLMYGEAGIGVALVMAFIGVFLLLSAHNEQILQEQAKEQRESAERMRKLLDLYEPKERPTIEPGKNEHIKAGPP